MVRFPNPLNILILITVKSTVIKLTTTNNSNSVAKHYQKSLRIQGKRLPKAKPMEWTSWSIKTFSGSLFLYHIWRTVLHSQALFNLFPNWHLLSLLVFCSNCEALLNFWGDEENSAARPLLNTHLHQKATRRETCREGRQRDTFELISQKITFPSSLGYFYNDLLLTVITH